LITQVELKNPEKVEIAKK